MDEGKMGLQKMNTDVRMSAYHNVTNRAVTPSEPFCTVITVRLTVRIVRP